MRIQLAARHKGASGGSACKPAHCKMASSALRKMPFQRAFCGLLRCKRPRFAMRNTANREAAEPQAVSRRHQAMLATGRKHAADNGRRHWRKRQAEGAKSLIAKWTLQSVCVLPEVSSSTYIYWKSDMQGESAPFDAPAFMMSSTKLLM